MKLLLDTHVLIRILEDESIDEIEKDETYRFAPLYVSLASLWEMSIKISLGKLSLSGSFSKILIKLEQAKIQLLPIDHSSLTKLIDLPWLHKDPFDRLIIAQSLVHNFTLVTDDSYIRNYPEIKTL